MKDLETIILPVLEMSCAVCANNVENTVKGLPGVEEASVNFAANTLSVKYHPSLITPQKMREAVQEAGYDLVVEVEDPTAVQEEMAREHYRKLRRNTIGAWVLSIPLALLGMVFMHTPGGNWIMMALALVIMIVFGRSFYVNGVRHALHGSANMDTLVALSTSIAFLFSFFNTDTADKRAYEKYPLPPTTSQTIKVSIANPTTIGTNIPLILSTIRCTGALLP